MTVSSGVQFHSISRTTLQMQKKMIKILSILNNAMLLSSQLSTLLSIYLQDFADIFEVTTNEKGKEEIIEKTKIEEISDENKRSKYSKDSEEKEHLPNDEKSNKKQLTEDQAKDSGVDSPDLKKENTDIELKIDGDEEMGEVEMTEPPAGYIKDSSGRIIVSTTYRKLFICSEIRNIYNNIQ